MDNLEKYISEDNLCKMDPLIKMAIIHHQFESIHPFYDGNGRTGRIINVLFLVKHGLLDSPILYLSRYINQNKNKCYKLLQKVREDKGAWQDWILFILQAVIETSTLAGRLIENIQQLMQKQKSQIRDKLPKIYSQKLLNNLFYHPYTKVEFLAKNLKVHRNTARKYLNDLSNIQIVSTIKFGNENLYVNRQLFNLLKKAG